MKIAVIFSRPQKWTLFSWLIRKWIKRHYSHCCIAIPHGDYWLITEASYGEVHCISELNWRKKNKVVDKVYLQLDHEESETFKLRMIDSLQKPYGFKTIVGVMLRGVFGIGQDHNKSFTCSEYAAYLLPQRIDNKLGDYIRPDDVEDLLNGK